MPPSRPAAILALVAWTFLVWTTRIGNIWGDDELTNGEKWGRTGLALSFTILALVVVVALWRRTPWQALAVRFLAGWTVAVWALRSVGIAGGDHDAAFIAVHLVLAVASIALSALALRATAPTPARQ
jgi:signal transduction histidine kinase